MVEVQVHIRGRDYTVSCEAGEEEHVARLAAYVDQRANDLAEEIGQTSPQQLLVMVSLLVADELSEAYDQIKQLEDSAKSAEASGRAAASAELDAKLAPTIDQLAQRVEAIAARLESD